MPGQRKHLIANDNSGQYYIRSPTIEVAFPRASEDTEYLSLNGLVNATDQIESLSALELLWYHDDEPRLLVTPQVSTEQTGSQTELTSTKFTESKETIHGSVARQISQRLVEILPPNYGIALGHADLMPLGITPTWTIRILLSKNNEVPAKTFFAKSPVVETIKTLVRNNIPYVVQTLILDRGLVSVRIAVFGQHKPAHTDEFFKWLYYHDETDISPIWNNTGFETTLDLPIGNYWKKLYDTLLPRNANYRRPSHSWDMRHVYTGSTEYQEVLLGRATSMSKVHTKTQYYGKIPAGNDIEIFAALDPEYGSVEWSQVPGRSPPHVQWEKIKRKPTGREKPPNRELLGTTKSTTVARNPSKAQTAGSQQHQEGIERIVKILQEHGYTAWTIDQDNSSVPDGILACGETPSSKLDTLETPTERIYTLEHESETLSNPTRILQNKERAAYSGMPTAVLVTGDATTSEREQMKQAVRRLTVPYRQKIPEVGVWTYNLDSNIKLPNGAIVVLPQDVTETCWHLTTDGQLRLMCNGECVATGPADADVTTFDYDLPRYTTEGGDYLIVGPDGAVMDRGHSATKWTKASPPHVPYYHHYFAGTHMLNTAANPASELPLPLADPSELEESKMDILRRIIKTYLDIALVKKEGAEVYRSRIQSEVFALLDQLTSPILDETDWPAVEKPNNTWFGRAWPDDEESVGDLKDSIQKFPQSNKMWKNEAKLFGEDTASPAADVIETIDGYKNGKNVRRIQDYAFVYPAGIVSPHTSRVDIDRRSILGDIPSDT